MLNDFAKMLGDFQDTFKAFEERQAGTIFSATSGGGLVKVSINGAGEVVDLSIDKSLLEDVESLQILLIGAINEAYKNVESGKKNAAMDMLGAMSPFKQ